MNSMGLNLVFLVSQPRAGSTLLQRILGGHPQVHTTSEPWLMLEVCELLQPREPRRAYEAGGWARLARDEFLKTAGGRDAYVAGVRAFADTVYARALASSGKSVFLDKTPRYYHILPELAEIFPQARLILLYRNPLAVLCSIVRTWVQEPVDPSKRTRVTFHWDRMTSYRHDLLEAPVLLASGLNAWGARARILRYESLVVDPAREVESLCQWLGIPYETDMLVYGGKSATFAFGDPSGVHRHREPSAASLERWREALREPELWRLARDYLAYLKRFGPDPLGYSGADMTQAIHQSKPPLWRRVGGRSLLRLLQAQ